MLILKDDYDIYKKLIDYALDDKYCGHSTYVSDADNVTEALRYVNLYTDAEPGLIEFDNSGNDYYMFELYYDENVLSYSICPACDDDGVFYGNFGLCLVDNNIPDNFESDYSDNSLFDKDYVEPERVIVKDEEEISSDIKINTLDDGTVSGFTKTWKNKDSYFSYTYHSTNENDVLDLMKNLKFNF